MTDVTDKPAGSGWQAQKSASTRHLILDAAITCFIELGYSQTTTARISKQAGLSRGAMLHHFPSKMILVQAAIDYLHKKRVEHFRDSMQNISVDDEDRINKGIDAYWEHLQSPLFTAHHELFVAARTDAELNEILQPAIDEFTEEWRQTCDRVFPEWLETGEYFDFALDLTQTLMEGMAISRDIVANESRSRPLLDYLKQRLGELLKSGKNDGPEQRASSS